MKGRLILVSAGLVIDGSRVLLSRRGAEGPLKGCWEFPGGKVEQHESPEEALIREMREEVALTVSDLAPWRFVSHSYPNRHVLMNVFHCRSFQGRPKAADPQVLEVRWFGRDEVGDLKWPPANGPLLGGLMETLAR